MGSEVIIEDIKENDEHYKVAIKNRDILLDNVSLYDDDIAELILNGKEISAKHLESSI